MKQELLSRRTALQRLACASLVPLASSLTACGGASGSLPPMSEAQRQSRVKSELDAILAAQWSTGQPGISVLVRLEGADLYRASRGSADAQGTPITSTTSFEIASLTKP